MHLDVFLGFFFVGGLAYCFEVLVSVATDKCLGGCVITLLLRDCFKFSTFANEA